MEVKARLESQLKLYKTVVEPSDIYGGEARIVGKS